MISKGDLVSVDNQYRKLPSIAKLYELTTPEERSMNLVRLIRENPQNETVIEDLIKLKIAQLFAYLNLIRPINEMQRDMVVQLMIEQYGDRLTIADFNIFFKMLMAGKLEVKILDRLDGNVIFEALQEYLRLKSDAQQMHAEKKHSKEKSLKMHEIHPDNREKLAEIFQKAATKVTANRPSRQRYNSIFNYCERHNLDYISYMKDLKQDFKAMFDQHVLDGVIDPKEITFEMYQNTKEYELLYHLNKDLNNGKKHKGDQQDDNGTASGSTQNE